MIDNHNNKLLIITEVFFPEDFLINDLVFHWKYLGYDVSVLTRNPSYPGGKICKGYKNKLFQKEIINNIPVSRVQFIPGYKDNIFLKITNYFWNMLLGILWGIKNGKAFDSVYIYQTGPLTFSAPGIVIKKIYHKKTTIWTQDIWPDTVYAYGLAQKGISKIILNMFVKWIYSNCDNITVSSSGFQDIIQKLCPSKTIHFIPQWSLTAKSYVNDLFTDRKFDGNFNFIFAGNIGKVQNLENLILGFDLFIKNTVNKEVWLNLIGDGSNLNFLRKMVMVNKISKVKFLGRINSGDMPYYFNQADVLIITLENRPIFNLTIPAKFQSYLNAEKPIFGVINGEVADLIINNNLGWIASPDNITEIASLFQEIVSTKQEMMTEKTKNAHILLEDQFNRDKIIMKFTKLVFN